MTNAIVTDVHAATSAAGLRLAVRNVRPLPASNPQGISQLFFVVALLVPSLVFGNLLVSRISRDLHPLWQVAGIAVYAAIVAGAAAAIADPAIGALTGTPWGLFGIGTLLAFAAAVVGAAATRWAGSLGYVVMLLLFVPVGIAASGATLGPNMITAWYADVGKALPVGSALPAIQNTVYFSAHDITTPLLILSAWALAGIIAMAMAAILHPRLPALPGEQSQQPGPSVDDAALTPVGRHARI